MYRKPTSRKFRKIWIWLCKENQPSQIWEDIWLCKENQHFETKISQIWERISLSIENQYFANLGRFGFVKENQLFADFARFGVLLSENATVRKTWTTKAKMLKPGPKRHQKSNPTKSDVFFGFPTFFSVSRRNPTKSDARFSQLQAPETFYNCPKETTRPEFIQETKNSSYSEGLWEPKLNTGYPFDLFARNSEKRIGPGELWAKTKHRSSSGNQKNRNAKFTSDDVPSVSIWQFHGHAMFTFFPLKNS